MNWRFMVFGLVCYSAIAMTALIYSESVPVGSAHIGLSSLGAFNISMTLSKRGMGGYEDHFKVADCSMQRLMQLLRSYVGAESFFYSKFRADLPAIRKTITGIAPQIQKSSSQADLKKRYRFLNDVSNIMEAGMNSLLLLQDSDLAECFLTHKVIELNVRALVLFNSYGALDLTLDGIRLKLVQFRENLLFWRTRFRALPGVSMDVSRSFEQKVAITESTLYNLEKFL